VVFDREFRLRRFSDDLCFRIQLLWVVFLVNQGLQAPPGHTVASNCRQAWYRFDSAVGKEHSLLNWA
jgi:hypothetical protein